MGKSLEGLESSVLQLHRLGKQLGGRDLGVGTGARGASAQDAEGGEVDHQEVDKEGAGHSWLSVREEAL